MASVALAGCTSRGEPAALPAAAHAEPAKPEPRSCRYEVAGAPRSLLADVSGSPWVDVGAVDSTVLAVHQAWNAEARTFSIRGRMAGPQAPSGELVLSEPGTFVLPRVVEQGDRLFVWWERQSPEAIQGRWVAADGTLGPVAEIPLPVILGASLVPTPTGFSVVYLEGREGGDTLHRQLLDQRLSPLGPPLAIDDTQRFDGASIGQYVRANGEIWAWAVGTGRKRPSDQVHLVRMSAKGEVLGPVTELTDSEMEAARVSMLAVRGGVLMTWLAEREVGLGPARLFTRKLDDSGAPVGAPTEIMAGARRFDALELVPDGGAPLLVADGGRHVPLDARGVVVAEKAEPIPVEVRGSYWLRTKPSPSLAWVEPRGGERGELMFASLRCVAEGRPATQ